MVGVQLSGGLGNQMFEYALYLKLKSMGKDVRIDDVTCYGAQEKQRVNQLSVFGVSYERMTKQEYEQIADSSMSPLHRARRLLRGRKDLSYREASCNYDPEILRREPALLLGYFQTERYFADIKEQVREAFTFRNLTLTKESAAMEQQMKECESVSVHIRRGDYLTPANQALFGGICDLDYYHRAVAEIRKRKPDVKFFLFSNDMEWTKEHFCGSEFVPVEGNSEQAGEQDLYLMSCCKHHILAHSSF